MRQVKIINRNGSEQIIDLNNEDDVVHLLSTEGPPDLRDCKCREMDGTHVHVMWHSGRALPVTSYERPSKGEPA